MCFLTLNTFAPFNSFVRHKLFLAHKNVAAHFPRLGTNSEFLQWLWVKFLHMSTAYYEQHAHQMNTEYSILKFKWCHNAVFQLKIATGRREDKIQCWELLGKKLTNKKGIIILSP